MTTLVRTFLGSVSTVLQDISPQWSRWPEAELVVYANYAQRAIAKYLPQAGSRADAIQLTPGTKQDLTKVLAAKIKPGDGSTAADTYGIALLDVIRNMGADGATPGRVVRICDRYAKDTNDPDWHTKVGTVVREFIYDKALPRVFYAVPGVHASTPVWVEVQWMAEPTRIPDGGVPGSEKYNADGTGASATPNALMGIHDQFIEDAQNYVVAMALLKGSKAFQNVPKAQIHAGLFTASINAQAAVLTGVNPNLKTLPLSDQIPGGAA